MVRDGGCGAPPIDTYACTCIAVISLFYDFLQTSIIITAYSRLRCAHQRADSQILNLLRLVASLLCLFTLFLELLDKILRDLNFIELLLALRSQDHVRT